MPPKRRASPAARPTAATATLRQRSAAETTSAAATATPAERPSSQTAACASPKTILLEQAFRFLADDEEEANDADATSDASNAASPSGSSFWIWLMLLMFALLLRYGVSGGGYSGAGVPPMYGDYEAQRHWMEVTVNLPVSEWYHNTTRNDLQYWGLDYPPLTAYVSQAFGRLAQLVGEGDLVALGTSRGYESITSKYFMRMTVMLCDLLLFLPAVALAIGSINSTAPRWHRLLLTHLVWICPAFILIDHGHFQYNCFSLGLVVYAVWLHWQGRDRLGAIAFVLSLTFKQMSLYYAPAFFAYLLARTRTGKGKSIVPLSTTFTRLVLLGGVVILTFAACFAPFLTSVASLAQVFHRMFPFARGLYEDKVSNFWCASSILVKWHLWFPRERMVQASLACTVTAFLPSCLHVYLHPSRRSFLYTIAGCAFSFYLFSFQVHEKTILLPLLPVALLVGQHPLLFAWISAIANFSMYPLLEKDGHVLTYAVLQIFSVAQTMSYARAGLLAPAASRDHAASPAASALAARLVQAATAHPLALYRLVQASLCGTVVLHVLWFVAPSSARYPDLMTMAFVIYSAAHFLLAFLVIGVNQWATPLQATEDEDRQPHQQPQRQPRASKSE